MTAGARESGQASVELVAVLPALLAVTLLAVQLALAGYGLWTSANAARAGARAAYVGGDAQAAARSALPRPLRGEARVREGKSLGVSLEVPALLPGVDGVRARARTGLDPAGGGG